MEGKNIKAIKETVSELLDKMGFVSELEIEEKSQVGSEKSDKEEIGENNLVCNIKIEGDSNFLIGQHGVNLKALQHIARLVSRKKTEDKINFILDVNSYRQQKNRAIADLAESVAKQVLEEKRAIVMKPMDAFERRIVHMTLDGNNQINTESIGEGEDRRVIVKPAGEV